MIANTESFLAVDIGNTHAHFGIINQRKILDQWSVPTSSLGDDLSLWSWQDKLKGKKLSGCCYCSVAPSVNKVFERHLSKIVKKIHHLNCRNINETDNKHYSKNIHDINNDNNNNDNNNNNNSTKQCKKDGDEEEKESILKLLKNPWK